MRTPCGFAFEDKRAEGRAIVRVHILDPAALTTSSQALVSFWPYGDVGAGNVIIVLANLLEPSVWSVARWVVGSTPGSHASLWYSQTRLQGLGEEASAKGSNMA